MERIFSNNNMAVIRLHFFMQRRSSAAPSDRPSVKENATPVCVTLFQFWRMKKKKWRGQPVCHRLSKARNKKQRGREEGNNNSTLCVFTRFGPDCKTGNNRQQPGGEKKNKLKKLAKNKFWNQLRRLYYSVLFVLLRDDRGRVGVHGLDGVQ